MSLATESMSPLEKHNVMVRESPMYRNFATIALEAAKYECEIQVDADTLDHESRYADGSEACVRRIERLIQELDYD